MVTSPHEYVPQLTPSEDVRSLNSLMFRKLMPLLVAAYVISFLDRTNIALAKDRMAIDLGISAAATASAPGCSS